MKLPLLSFSFFVTCACSLVIQQPSIRSSHRLYVSAESSSSTDYTVEEGLTDPLGLPPELRRISDAFASVGDAQMRHKQLFYMAGELPTIEPSKCVPENKVPGCLSTVYIDGQATWSDEKQANVINFVGDSDGLLTKGLVALLCRGLSGSTATEIQAVDPSFIQAAKIGPTLTPGRNNGFLNMLATMKKKALELDVNPRTPRTSDDGGESAPLNSNDDKPMYNGIIQALQVLKPTKLELIDNSHQHAGHEGSKGYNGESHFELNIVAEAFDGLNLVKRHQLIYVLLGEIMPKIHALQIQARTPSEAAQD